MKSNATGEADGHRHGIVRGTAAVLREQPRVALPFVGAGLVAGAHAAYRIASPVPVAVRQFPDQGVFHVGVSVFPGPGLATQLGPGALFGLKLQFLAALFGWGLATAIAGVLATAVVLWTTAEGTTGLLPPRSRLRLLLAYAVAVQTLFFGALQFGAWIWFRPALWLWIALLSFPAAIGLFLTPAVIVREGRGVLTAVRSSVARVLGRPLSVALLLVGVEYVGYLLTGVAGVVGDPALVGPVIGSVVSVAGAGTLYGAALVAAYELTRP